MAFTVDIKIKKQLKVNAGYDLVFDTLADIPYSVQHFPKVKKLHDLGEECYRWEMEKIGLDRYSIQTIYASEYTWDKEAGWIEWAALDDAKSNAVVEGRWKIKAVKEGVTQLNFATTGELTMPLPSLAKLIVAPLVRREFEGMVGQYLENLQEMWSQL